MHASNSPNQREGHEAHTRDYRLDYRVTLFCLMESAERSADAADLCRLSPRLSKAFLFLSGLTHNNMLYMHMYMYMFAVHSHHTAIL